MDRKKAIINICVSVFNRIIILVFLVVSRRMLIQQVGDDAVGLYSLYLSIMGTLSVAESGLGVAIIFSMYKHIAQKNDDQVTALYYLYKKIYKYIAIIIISLGILITPLIPYFAKGYVGTVSIYRTYLMMVIATGITYFFAGQTSLFNAYKNNYIGSIINTLGLIVQSIIQIGALIIYKSFDLYIAAIIVGNITQWGMTVLVYRIKYKDKMTINREVSLETKNEIKKNMLAMISHKVGGTLVVSINGIIISSIISVVVLGTYTNYNTIMTAMTSILTLFFTSLTSIVGHRFTLSNKETFYGIFKKAFVVNYTVGVIFFLGYLAVIEDLIQFVFNPGFVLQQDVILIFVISSFINFMRHATLMFKDATGTFYNDRFKPLLEGLINVVLSITLGHFFGIFGIIASLIITNLSITHVIEPYVLYKYALDKKVKNYYIKNYLGIILFSCIAIGFQKFVPSLSDRIYLNILMRGSLSIIVSISMLSIIFFSNKDFRIQVLEMLVIIKNIIRKKKEF